MLIVPIATSIKYELSLVCDFTRPISTVTFCCTATISIAGKWNYLNELESTVLYVTSPDQSPPSHSAVQRPSVSLVSGTISQWTQVYSLVCDFTRPISTVTFCCTATISISGKWNYLNEQVHSFVCDFTRPNLLLYRNALDITANIRLHTFMST